MRDALQDLSGKLNECHHPGLLMDCFFPGQGDESGEAKATHFQTMIKSSTNDGAQKFYKDYFDRWKKNRPARSLTTDLKTAGHIVLGLGRASVMEVGIHLHHSLGFPYLPGSSLKGACAHYCARVWGAKDDRFKSEQKEGQAEKTSGEFHKFLFGDTTQAGAIAFEDAWWVPAGKASPFHREVMTPHHKDWQDGGKAPPTDFDSPVPVSFLSFSGTFHFRVIWQGPEPENELEKAALEKWLNLALDLLKETLAESGVGGKTSSGFGRLKTPAGQPAGTASAAHSLKTPNQGHLRKLRIVEKIGNRHYKAVYAENGEEAPCILQSTSKDCPNDLQPGAEVTVPFQKLDKGTWLFGWQKQKP